MNDIFSLVNSISEFIKDNGIKNLAELKRNRKGLLNHIYKCPKCDEGYLECKGVALDMYSKKFKVYECTNCSYIELKGE